MELPPAREVSQSALRQKMLEETELALLYGLRFPERVTRIPRIRAGAGFFHPTYAARLWANVLGLDED